MKKLLIILFSLAVLFSCKKVNQDISNNPFKITSHYVATSSVDLDVVPENNDFYWYYDVISVSDFNSKGTIEACIKETDKKLKESYETYREAGLIDGPFCETMLYRGSYIVSGINLKSKENYIAYSYAYEEDGTATNKYQTLKFQTYEFIPSDIKFSLSLTGSNLTFTPTNNDTYYCTYELKSIIDEDWGDYPFAFLYIDIFRTVQYGFFDFLEVSGTYTEDILEYLPLKEGDKFIVFVCGYNHDITSAAYEYECTYAGEGKEGSVKLIDIQTL